MSAGVYLQDVRGVSIFNREAVYDTTFPGTFRVGDIVEVHGSFVAFTAKKGKEMRMQLLLQSVTLLDSSFTKVSRDECNQKY